MGGIGLKKISLAVQLACEAQTHLNASALRRLLYNGSTISRWVILNRARNAVVPVLSEVDATVLNDTNADNNRTW